MRAYIAVLAGLIMSCQVWADDNALQLADLIGGKEQYQRQSHQVLLEMIRKQPAMARYQDVVQRWAQEYLDRKSVV